MMLRTLSVALMLWTTMAIASDALPLKTHVTVVDSTGASNRLVFQGRADGEALTGQLYLGAITWDVTGTIGSDGVVEGNVAAPATGTTIGAFSGELDAAGELTGAFTINQAFGDFTAPADQLPTPES